MFISSFVFAMVTLARKHRVNCLPNDYLSFDVLRLYCVIVCTDTRQAEFRGTPPKRVGRGHSGLVRRSRTSVFQYQHSSISSGSAEALFLVSFECFTDVELQTILLSCSIPSIASSNSWDCTLAIACSSSTPVRSTLPHRESWLTSHSQTQ